MPDSGNVGRTVGPRDNSRLLDSITSCAELRETINGLNTTLRLALLKGTSIQ